MSERKVKRGSNYVFEVLRTKRQLLDTGRERRRNDRYPLVRDVVYKVIMRRGEPKSGRGTTVDISSRGVLFTAQSVLPPDTPVELAISWPAQLGGTCSLQLVARGRVVRCQGLAVAVEIDEYQFRTQGSRGLPAA